MKISQESDFVGKGFGDSFQRLAGVNSREDLSKKGVRNLFLEFVAFLGGEW
jgi:hypothetical protein